MNSGAGSASGADPIACGVEFQIAVPVDLDVPIEAELRHHASLAPTDINAGVLLDRHELRDILLLPRQRAAGGFRGTHRDHYHLDRPRHPSPLRPSRPGRGL